MDLKKSFTLFPLLPLELRRKIWTHTFQPQILEYRLSTVFVPGFIPTQVGNPTSYNQFCTQHLEVTVVLHVCHESRSVALEHYVLSSGGTQPPESLQDYPDLTPRPIYFNASIDVVRFENFKDSMDSPACWRQSRHMAKGSYGASPDFKHVKRLLLDATEGEDLRWRSVADRQCRRGPQLNFFTEFFPSLEEILLTQSCEHPLMIPIGVESSTEAELGKSMVLELRCRMEQDFRNIVAAKLPGWRPPEIKIVRSRTNLTEIIYNDIREDERS